MGGSSGPTQKAAEFEKADAYCRERGKAVQVIKASDSGSGGSAPATQTRCDANTFIIGRVVHRQSERI